MWPDHQVHVGPKATDLGARLDSAARRVKEVSKDTKGDLGDKGDTGDDWKHREVLRAYRGHEGYPVRRRVRVDDRRQGQRGAAGSRGE